MDIDNPVLCRGLCVASYEFNVGISARILTAGIHGRELAEKEGLGDEHFVVSFNSLIVHQTFLPVWLYLAVFFALTFIHYHIEPVKGHVKTQDFLYFVFVWHSFRIYILEQIAWRSSVSSSFVVTGFPYSSVPTRNSSVSGP